MDVSQVIDKAQQLGLNHKLQHDLLKHYCKILRSYLSDIEYSELKEISAGIHNVLGQVLFLLYTSSIPLI